MIKYSVFLLILSFSFSTSAKLNFNFFGKQKIELFAGISWDDSLEVAVTKLVQKKYKVEIELPYGRTRTETISSGEKTNDLLEKAILSTFKKARDHRIRTYYKKYKDESGVEKYAPSGNFYVVVKDVRIKNSLYELKFRYGVSHGVLIEDKDNVIQLKNDTAIKLPLKLTEVVIDVKEGDVKELKEIIWSKYKFDKTGVAQGKISWITTRANGFRYVLENSEINRLKSVYEKYQGKLSVKNKADSTNDL